MGQPLSMERACVPRVHIKKKKGSAIASHAHVTLLLGRQRQTDPSDSLATQPSLTSECQEENPVSTNKVYSS